MRVIGWGAMGTRCVVYEPVVVVRPEMVFIADEVRIDSFVKIEGGQGVYIDRWVHIASLVHINIGGGKVRLMEGSAYASGAKVLGGSNSPEGVSMSANAPPEQQVVSRGRTVIGKNAFVGVNAVVMPGVMVGEGAVIGAGAVVTKDVPDFEIWAGVPARRIGGRARK